MAHVTMTRDHAASIVNASLEIKLVYAQFGNHDHRDLLVGDPSLEVKRVIAEYGNDSHRDLLLASECWQTRSIVLTMVFEEYAEYDCYAVLDPYNNSLAY